MEEKIISWFKVVYNKIKYEQNPKLRDFVNDNKFSNFFSKLYPSKSCSPLDEVEVVSNNAKLFHEKLKNQFCFSIDKDIIVVLWWDWTMLEAIANYIWEDKIFLWLNFWNKWFLMNDLSILEKDLDLKKLEYPLLECSVWWQEKVALNEIDISSCFWRMVDLNISLNQNYSIDLVWDWLIISTPIWSSWYNLSLWWPIIPHDLKSFIITPKAPWKPTKQSPIMLDDSEELYIKSNNDFSSVDIYIDGVLFKKIRDF